MAPRNLVCTMHWLDCAKGLHWHRETSFVPCMPPLPSDAQQFVQQPLVVAMLPLLEKRSGFFEEVARCPETSVARCNVHMAQDAGATGAAAPSPFDVGAVGPINVDKQGGACMAWRGELCKRAECLHALLWTPFRAKPTSRQSAPKETACQRATSSEASPLSLLCPLTATCQGWHGLL